MTEDQDHEQEHEPPAAWRNRAEAAEELGITRPKLAGMAAQGAPIPLSGEIPKLPLLLWAWSNRERVVGEKRARALARDIDNRRKQVRLQRDRVELNIAERTYLSRARQAYDDTVGKLRRALDRDLRRGAARRFCEFVTEPNPAERERKITSLLNDLVEQCVKEGLS